VLGTPGCVHNLLLLLARSGRQSPQNIAVYGIRRHLAFVNTKRRMA